MIKKRLEDLSDLEYYVIKEQGTEPPFQNEFDNHFEKGIYVDKLSGTPLFTSMDKFQSHCGWPSFSKPIDQQEIVELVDKSHGMTRTEVRSNESDAHLGHVFNDGPSDLGGLRYCINSASIMFVPYEKLEELGYSEFIDRFQ